MRETANLTGMVLKATPSGEYDRRLVILTRERRKIADLPEARKGRGTS